MHCSLFKVWHDFSPWCRPALAKKVVPLVFLAATLLPIPTVLSAPGFGTPPLQTLAGHVPKITRRLSPQGRLNANYHLDLAIGLPLRHREQLTNLLADLYNPSSPNFHRYLTSDQFTASFGPSLEDYQKVIDFAKAHGLVVKKTHPNRTLLDVSGSVADIEQAFHVHLLTYRHPVEPRTFFAPDTEPSLDLATPVLAVSGLDNYVKPHPHLHPAVRPWGGVGGGGGGGDTTGDITGPFEGYDFLNAYAPGISLDGTGQKVGLFELFAFSQQDIQDYEDEVGTPSYVNVQPILIDGATGDDSVDYLTYPGYQDYGAEVTGDIEMAIAFAPGLDSVLVYEGPTPVDEPPLGTNYTQGSSTTAQINDVLNRMATDDLAQQLSCSYGFDINLSTVQIFQQYAAQGQSFFLASGDSGAYPATIDEPADDPYITVVGGTTLTTDTNDVWVAETAWLTPATNDPTLGYEPEEASGGGISPTYAIPPWQQGLSMADNQGSTTMRNLPDVSSVAFNITIVWGNDYLNFYGLQGIIGSQDYQVNGTSMAAPLWAGLMALANQQAALNGQAPVGFANPALYAIAKSTNYQSCFNDITTGCNTNSSSPTKFYAVAGYDLCTGLGTPNVNNLIPALLAPPVDTLRVTPPLGFISQGPSGGPFSITAQTYTLTNTGPAALKWSLANVPSWLTVSATGGTLNPGGPGATVTVSLNTNANAFLIAHPTGNLAFNNLTAGTTQNRQFDLYVGNGGFETGDLTDWTTVGNTTFIFALAADDADIAGENKLPGQPDALFVRSGLYGGYLGVWPNNGTLSQSLPTVAGRQLLVSFWLTSVSDEHGKTTPNAFAAKWNGATLFQGTNLPAFGWTNLQYVVYPTSSTGTLAFSFNNTPGAFGLDDVTVQPVPAPVLNSAAVSGRNVAFSWTAYPNASYVIQATTNIGRSAWTTIGSPAVATNSVMSVTLPIANSPAQFYRVAIPAP